MKSVLIFGSGGFVGSYLAREFFSHGYIVYGTDIAPLKSPQDCFTEYALMNMLEADKVMKLIERTSPDYIINLAAVSSVGDSWNIPQKTVEVNINGTLNILEAVRKLRITSTILLVGSSEEYAVSDSPISEGYPLERKQPLRNNKDSAGKFRRDLQKKLRPQHHKHKDIQPYRHRSA